MKKGSAPKRNAPVCCATSLAKAASISCERLASKRSRRTPRTVAAACNCLIALRNYDILGSPAELAYDEIAELAAQICQCPVGVINFLDDKSVWTKCRYGL